MTNEIQPVNEDQKDKIAEGIKKADDAFQTTQEFIDSWRQTILENEKVMTFVAFVAGSSFSWLLSSCTQTILITFSHKVMITLLILLASLLLISTKTIPLAYIAIMIVSTLIGLGLGELAIAWDSNTYMVATVSQCQNPVQPRDFLIYILGAVSGMLYVGKRYKLF